MTGMTDMPAPGEQIDLLKLKEIRQRERINVYLYMDAEIAKTRMSMWTYMDLTGMQIEGPC